MITFSPTTYGKDEAVKIPELSGLEDSVRRSGERAIQTEELKLQKALSNKKDFEKALEVDPVSAISKANTIRQALAIEKYNNAVAGLYAKNNGELTYADQIAVANAKNDLKSFQGKLLAEENEYKEAKGLSQKDARGYYDPEYFRKAEAEFLNTGEMPKGGFLNVNAVNPVSVLSKLPSMGEQSEVIVEDVVDDKGNIAGKKETQYKTRMTVDQAKEQIFQSFANEPVVKGYIKAFEGLPEAEQNKWLKDYDKNGNGVVDPAEREFAYSQMDMKTNPIVQWAMNNPDYINSARGREAMAAKNLPNTSTKAFNWNVNIGGRNNRNTAFEVYQNKTTPTSYGKQKTFPDYMNLGQVSATTDPQSIDGIIEYDENGNRSVRSVVDNTRLELTGYSPAEDVLIVKVVDDGEVVSKGEVLYLDASKYNDLLKRKPWGIDRASLVKTPKVIKSGELNSL